MSGPRLLPERIDALLAPDALHLRRDGASELVTVAPVTGASAWRAPLAALDQALQSRPPRRPALAARLPAALAASLAPRLDIVLSERFARWQVLPWQAEVATPEEQEAYARHRFREVYGDVARHWQVRCAPQPPGVATPACAIDGELLTALRALAAAHGCQLGSLRTLFASAAKRWGRKLPRGIAWLAMFEAGHLSLGLLQDRRLLALHGEPLGAATDSGEVLAGLLARTAIGAGIATDGGRLLLCGEGAATCPVPLPAKAVQRLGGALAWSAGAAAGAASA
jgi:hypothetical protein